MSVTGQTSRLQELEIATQVVRIAGDIALRQFGRVERLTKTHATTTQEAVTIADRAVHPIIRTVAAVRGVKRGVGVVAGLRKRRG